MAQSGGDNIHLGLLARFTGLILCSACLRLGVRTPVPQVISHRHRPRSLCPACRERRDTRPRAGATLARLQ